MERAPDESEEEGTREICRTVDPKWECRRDDEEDRTDRRSDEGLKNQPSGHHPTVCPLQVLVCGQHRDCSLRRAVYEDFADADDRRHDVDVRHRGAVEGDENCQTGHDYCPNGLAPDHESSSVATVDYRADE